MSENLTFAWPKERILGGMQRYGSVELGPIAGPADQIADSVETCEALRQNHLVEVETIMRVTSRLIHHPARQQVRPRPVAEFVEALRRVVDQEHASPRKAAAAP